MFRCHLSESQQRRGEPMADIEGVICYWRYGLYTTMYAAWSAGATVELIPITRVQRFA